MDCACLPLLYMDGELVWRSVILFSHSPSSTPFFGGNRESLQSSLHIFQVRWLGWMTLDPGRNESLSLLHWKNSVTKKDTDLLPPGFSCKIFTLPTFSDPWYVACFSRFWNAFSPHFLDKLMLPSPNLSDSKFSMNSLLIHINKGARYFKIRSVYVCVLACRKKGLNKGWVDLESWQVHYCSRLWLAWHVCS